MKLLTFIACSLLVCAVACSGKKGNGGNTSANGNGDSTGVQLESKLVVQGLDKPLFVCSAPGDSTRLFIVEKPGTIRIYQDDSILTTPFLDVAARVNSAASERGLLGLAFHPDYDNNGFFFINYTDLSGNTVVSRFSVTADPDIADNSSEQTILSVDQPYANHNAGMLAFSPVDNYLYVGLGDGGSAGDPGNRAQNPTELLGKMLRIDVNQALPYAIPSDNPFAQSQDTLSEIWAFGLRNPWRYSFDRATGDLWIADVGQYEIEEVNFQTVANSGGDNYGWRIKEGTACFNPSSDCNDTIPLADPIAEYRHSDPGSPCSITGGYVYRGCAVSELTGTYFFADYCSGQIWSLRFDGTTVSEFTERTAQLARESAAISCFGEDFYGELYFLDYAGGKLYKIVPQDEEPEC